MTAFRPDLAEEAVPRYTSYPPANRFKGDVGAEDVTSWLAALTGETRVSLYAHIPFCKQLCWYCGCHTNITKKRAPVQRLVEGLLEEIAIAGRALTARPRAASMHFGGGSPDLLTPDDVTAVKGALTALFAFEEEAEIAAELDPRGVNAPLVRAFAEAGLTRASFGVQEMNEDVQRAIGRLQFPDTVRHAVRMLKEGGIERFNADLLYGLPGQTADMVAASCRFVADIGASRVAVFGYAHVPWFKKHQSVIDEAALPGTAARFVQAETAAEVLTAAGYERIGFDHFALPDDSLAVAAREGRLHRNFQGFTPDDAAVLIGFGPSAISRYPQGFAQDATGLKDYHASLDEGRLPVARGHRLSAEEGARGALIERLLCDGEADLAPAVLEEAAPRLLPLAAKGLVALGDGKLRLTEMGQAYARNVAAALDPGFAASGARHSRAV